MNKTKLYLSLIAISLWGIECKDKKGDPPLECSAQNSRLFPKDAFQRCYFKDSTYWIYKNIANDSLDSTWVTNSESGYAGLGNTGTTESEGKCYQYGWYDVNSINKIDYYVSLFQNGPKKGAEYAQITFEPFNIGFNINFILTVDSFYRKDGDYIIDSLPIIKVNGKDYQDILKFTSKLPSQAPVPFISGYFAKNLGLIKFKRRDGSEWELLRSNIKQ